MSEIKEENNNLPNALNAAQLEKIRLEIDGLKRSGRESSLVRYLPLLTTLVAVAGFLFGIYQFKTQQDERLRAEKISNDREFKKALWEKQLNYYLEAAQAASTLASFNENDGKDIQPERTKARVRFWQLYYGELAIIEDPNVSDAMVKYGRCLRDYDLTKCNQSELKQHARVLAQACRNAVARSWDEPLGQIEQRP